jgi:hypothetical protein
MSSYCDDLRLRKNIKCIPRKKSQKYILSILFRV